MWFAESEFTQVEPVYTKIKIKVKETLYQGQSPFQKIDIYNTYDHGKMLTLDDIVMVTERDEFVYHEMLTHIPLFTHQNPENVLIIGGGDGGTLREVVKHQKVIKADMCEIDGLVVEKCQDYFNFFDGVLEQEKANLYIEDGFHFLEKNKNSYQVILVDSTDPVGEAEKLFDISFYKLCYDALSDDGILVVQSESPFYNLNIIGELKKKFDSLFQESFLYTANIPTYPSGYWSFMMGSKRYHPEKNFNESEVDTLNLDLNYYNKKIHQAAFVLPTYIQKGLQ